MSLLSELPEKISRDTMAVFGPGGSGKSRLGFTMPGRIGVLPLDLHAINAAQEAKARGIKGILWPKVMPKRPRVSLADMMRAKAAAKEGKEDPTMEACMGYWSDLHDVWEELCSKADSVIVDGGTHLAEDAIFANYGRIHVAPLDRKKSNSSLRTFFDVCTRQNMLVTHQSVELWDGFGKDAKPTGLFKMSGWKNLDYCTRMTLELRLLKVEQDVTDFSGEFNRKLKVGDFVAAIRKCNDNPDLSRAGNEKMALMVNKEISWKEVVGRVYGS